MIPLNQSLRETGKNACPTAACLGARRSLGIALAEGKFSRYRDKKCRTSAKAYFLRRAGGRLLGEMASVSADLAHGHVIPEHSHPEDQLLFASSGVMTQRTKQGVWVVPPMRAVWIPADTAHSVAMSGPVSMRTLYFLPRLCRRLPGKCFVMNVSSLLRELILHACKFKRLNKKASGERRIIEIIVEQLKEVDTIRLQMPHPTDARAMRVVKTLLADPGDQRDLERLCAECGG